MDHSWLAVIKQIFGKEQVFGYKNNLMNTVHLMYWFLGEFYRSKIFNKYITRSWIIFNIYAAISLFTHSNLYIFLTSKPHITFTLFATEIIVTMVHLLILTPLGVFLYTDGVIKTFKALDKSYDTELNSISSLKQLAQNFHLVNGTRKKYNLTIGHVVLAIQIGIFFFFLLSTYLDLVIGYSPSKLSNPKFSVLPLYCENVDRLGTFLVLLFSQIICGIPMGAMNLTIPFFTFIVTRQFFRKFQNLSDFLDSRSKIFQFYYEEFSSRNDSSSRKIRKLEKEFLNDVHYVAKFHHDLLRAVSNFRPYMEYTISIGLLTVLYMEIVLIYIFTLMNEESIMLKIKILCHGAFTASVLYMFCLTGKLYSDMCDIFRGAVYNIPWYYLSPKLRKSVSLLQCQAQVIIEFKAIKIHTTNMAFFLKLCNYVYSTVSLLRRSSTGL